MDFPGAPCAAEKDVQAMTANTPLLSAEIAQMIRAHMIDEHPLVPDEVIGADGRPIPGGSIDHLPETPRRPEGFACALCPGLLFFGEPRYGDPKRNAQLLRDHPDPLWSMTRGLDATERDLVVTEWDRGGLAADLATAIRRRRAMARSGVERPTVAERRGRCQEFLLDAYPKQGTVERAIAALVALADEDPVRHQQIVGRPYPMAAETYRTYWRDIPLARRAAALAARRAQGKPTR